MKSFALSDLERSQGFTHKVEITHEDLTEPAAATAQTLALLAVPAGSLVRNVASRLDVPFKNSADAAYNDVQVTVGDVNSVARFLAAQQVNENGTEVLYKAGTGTQYAYVADDIINLVANSMTGKSLVNLDTGKLTILLAIANIGKL